MKERNGQASLPNLVSNIVDALPDAALVISADARLVWANPAARRLFPAVRPNEPISRAIRSPDILDAVRAVRPGHSIGVKWLDRVPLERQFDVHAAALGAAAEGAVLVVLHDTTEARRIERMRADFIANASHELRTPLASLLGFVETLQGPARADPEAQQRFLAIMRDQGRRMSRLVDDLLSLSQIERSLHVQPAAEVDLAGVASHMADALTPMAQEENVVLQVVSSAPVYVRGERDELLRVAENLIENAIKYGGEGEVRIHVRDENGWGAMTVADNGPGIAPEHLPRLTERFYRISTEASRSKGGTGLGLAIVKHIVARHRGRFLIDSEPANGSRFSVLLPLSGQENDSLSAT